MTSAPKAESVDESFEDLLLKYKQIQLELECIRKEERIALKQEEQPAPAPAPEEEEKRAFQAFNLRPLRQKLLTPAERDALNSRSAPEAQTADAGGPEHGITDLRATHRHT